MPFFRSLPTEITLTIISSLCLCFHCHPPHPPLPLPLHALHHHPHLVPPLPPPSNRHPDSEDIKPSRVHSSILASLALTSHRLHALVTPILYHRPATSRWWLLARTLLARPDLAAHVRHLSLPDDHEWLEDEADAGEEVVAYWKTTLAAYIASLPPGGHVSNFAPERRLAESSEDYAMPVVASLCPKVECIEAVVGLRILALAHADTEMGIGLEALAVLASAAPGLEVLRGKCIADEGMRAGTGSPGWGGAMANVREVEMQWSAVSADSLKVLMRACPKMETLVYHAGGSMVGDVQFDPDEVRDVLLERAGTLKKVALELGESEWMGWDEPEEREIVEQFQQKGIELVVGFDEPAFCAMFD
ncbi:hypothetical protein N0V88_002716 [Collariella sp. IMI 366227]|nr:hypothetical protein N0V88_002716 [Collariella sp. IMI 366227]